MLFEDLARLLEDLEDAFMSIQSHDREQKRIEKRKLFYAPLRAYLRTAMANGKGTLYLVYSLFCPNEDIERKYGLKESMLSKALIQVFGHYPLVAVLLSSRSKDLSLAIQAIACGSSESEKTIMQINKLLDTLSAKCRFSSARVRAHADDLTSIDILRQIFRNMSPRASKWLVRILLKRPHHWSTNSFFCAFPKMIETYRFCSDLRACCDRIETSLLSGSYPTLDIEVGVCYSVMQSHKGTSIAGIVGKMKTWKMKSILAEIKYDG